VGSGRLVGHGASFGGQPGFFYFDKKSTLLATKHQETIK